MESVQLYFKIKRSTWTLHEVVVVWVGALVRKMGYQRHICLSRRRERLAHPYVSSSCCDFVVDDLSSLAVASTAAKYADWSPGYFFALRCIFAVRTVL